MILHPVQPLIRDESGVFAQLIGYSLSGFTDLSFVSDKLYERADPMGTHEG